MTVLDYILDGLEAELTLERELGARFVECDRSLLKPLSAPEVKVVERPVEIPQKQVVSPAAATPPEELPSVEVPSEAKIVFLHHKPLSTDGAEMMRRICEALKLSIPIVTEEPLPKAKVYVVLGGLALAKFFPDQKAEPGMYLKTGKGEAVLVTFSPEYILRFKIVTPTVQKNKESMWRSLKGVLRYAE